MTIKQRVNKLEEKINPQASPVFRFYYHDFEKGYSDKWDGPYFQTLEAMAKAQGWEIDETDTVIEIQYASQATA